MWKSHYRFGLHGIVFTCVLMIVAWKYLNGGFDHALLHTGLTDWTSTKEHDEATRVDLSEQSQTMSMTTETPTQLAGSDTIVDDQHSSVDRPSEDHLDETQFADAEAASVVETVPVQVYIKEIMGPGSTRLEKPLKCPAEDIDQKYHYLSTIPRYSGRSEISSLENRRYFFALDLYEIEALLPTLLGSIIEAIHFLGPSHCALSIVEGRSQDATYDILHALKPELEALGVEYHLETSDVNPKDGIHDRVELLAELRNQALHPLLDNPNLYHAGLHGSTNQTNTTVIFVNDVGLCVADILELVHQLHHQEADMTCAMDWIHNGNLFYDVWVSRGINGDTFFEIPQTGTWDYAENLFWNDQHTRTRFDAHLPFQVYACWNGIVAFAADPLFAADIRFRTADRGDMHTSVPKIENHNKQSHNNNLGSTLGPSISSSSTLLLGTPLTSETEADPECYMGEPTLFCKDLWRAGYNRIAVIPVVNVAYSAAETQLVKDRRGWAHKMSLASAEAGGEELIVWNEVPPGQVKCAPTWGQVMWVGPV